MNRQEWEKRGQQMVAEMTEALRKEEEEEEKKKNNTEQLHNETFASALHDVKATRRSSASGWKQSTA